MADQTEGAITFLQLSDTHILADDDELLGVRPAAQLRRTLDRIAGLAITPQFCLITGDLTHDSGEVGYRRLRQLLAPLTERGIPILVGLGNHDQRAPFRRGFLDERGDDERRYYHARSIGGLRIIVLDSLVPGAIHGELGQEQLAWLSAELRHNAPQGRLIALHHPVALVGLPWLSNDLLRDADDLEGILRGHDIVGILTGHCHTPSAASFAGTLATTAPAAAFQFVPGTALLTTTGDSGFNLCMIQDRKLLVTPIYS
ncbi:MAG TPA: metallophosphoesterase [Thermomicrobiales bacterium]|jgi:3',5'-cyclic AMP phosphodiesterase CpdA